MRKILIIDAGIAHALTRLLTAEGHDVVTATDEEAGLTLAVEGNPDLVILTIRTPIEEGLSIAKRLHEQAPAVPVMFVSASKEPRLKEAVTTLGAVGFVERPYDPAELLPAVTHALAESALRKLQPSAHGIKTGVGDSAVSGSDSVKPPSKIAGKRILLVEDDRKIAMALGVRLRHAGVEVSVAHDAPAGLATALKERPDLVLLDIGLPGGSGLKLIEQLHALGRSMTPVIFVTASRRPGLREEAMALGASGFLEKPFEAEELIAAIAQALGTDG